MLGAIFQFIASTGPTTAPTSLPAESALGQALQISGVALVAIFVVMGLFGVLITLLGKFLPERNEASE